MKSDIEEIYQRGKERYNHELARIRKKDNSFVLYRSLTVLTIVGLGTYGYLKDLLYFYYYVIPFIFMFVVLVQKHKKIRKKILNLEHLIQINSWALARLSGQWTSFSSQGQSFMVPEHPYSEDLNIFGQASLFQYINAANLVTGEQALAKLLLEKTSYEEINSRQRAIQELAPLLSWRQQLQALGMITQYQKSDLAKFWDWVQQKPLLANKKYIYLLWLLPLTTLIFLILMSNRIVSTSVPLAFLILQVLLAIVGQVFIAKSLQDTEKASEELERLSLLLRHIEEENFQAPLLVKLQKNLIQIDQRASQQVKALAKIAAIINLRNSVVYHFINALIFCDLYTIRAMDQWKSEYGESLIQWFQVIGQFEALSSLATLAHDNPHWVFPNVFEGEPSFSATELGHPLINEASRVANNVSLPHPGTIHIITGSNMSGKSTLLRTVGINLVLAYSGAPVCASGMSCCLMEIYTSMRIHDNLEQNISSFYAELKRIKMVIEAAQQGKPIIFLLDEIFRGTNSRDRIAGARTIIKNLAEQSVIGFVTTHDLELSTLESESLQHIRNYHFTDNIVDNEMIFDYHLKKGVSQTTNAIALMKMVGIKV
ncbi:MutS family DNA mismatch repair protein [Desulfotomaculum defluvii]